jgi:predicted glycoside hydrolase/deacetylase ChbG (UPF0249 family)
MLIINADDWGKNRSTTDNTLACFRNRRISSASAMVFMADSERAAALARQHGLGTGLHVNFTLRFDSRRTRAGVADAQARIAAFLTKSKYRSVLYNPLLKNDFRDVYRAQHEEFVRLYETEPTHFDGHHHMHICTNMLLNSMIPPGSKMRRGFSFMPGDRGVVNRTYRRIVDRFIGTRYRCTDFFFAVSPDGGMERLRRIVALATTNNVELMVHPERADEFRFLMSDDLATLIAPIERVSYAGL